MTSDPTERLRLPTEALRQPCRAVSSVADEHGQTVGSTEYPGQERATDALRFGTRIGRPGYNIFVLGSPGSDRHALAEQFARDQATTRPPPSDWCYVNNFSDPERPVTLRFAAGSGAVFRDDMQALIEELRLAIPAAFETEEYRNQVKAIEADMERLVESYWQEFRERAADENIAVLQTPTGFVLAPVRNGKVVSEKEFPKLSKEEQKEAQAAIERLGEEIEKRIQTMPRLQKRHRQRIKDLNRRVTEHAVGVMLDDLKDKYSEQPAVVAYLDAVQRSIVDNSSQFHGEEQSPLALLGRNSSRAFGQYEVNLLVDNGAEPAAPVVYEPNPSYQNTVGKIEYRAEMGALTTDFRMIRAGALHRANGGFLILDMHRILTRPFVWDALKRILAAERIRIESPGETYGLISTATLQPEPIPLDVKIILIGERYLYYLLCAYDPEFQSLFKVAADLDDDLSRSDENVSAYASFISARIRKHGLLPFDAAAVGRIIEERARLAGDSERLSTHMRSLEDLMMQADQWARQRQSKRVAIDDVDTAIVEGRRRLSRIQTRVIDSIARNTVLIDTSGECVGQVNGLSVVDLGEFRFGHPVRITATTRLGTGEIVDIEREVELGGAIHSKGVMILSAALSARYAADVPFSLRACLVFEQSYGGVEGDSASVAEYCALLSSLSKTPIRQSIAVTGSLNQLGQVQAVGGVNEKIEGYLEICRERGLDGSHGVIIPGDNVKHLMLGVDVVDAVNAGKFSIFAVKTADEALSILTGTPAGERDGDGRFPVDSVNGRVEEQLRHYAEVRRKIAQQGEGNDGKE